MQSALKLRLYALILPLVVILIGSVFFTADVGYWTFVLILTIILGYVHFVVGGIYQIKALIRKPRSYRYLIWFAALSIVSILFCYWLITTGYQILLGIFTISYFVIHVLLNEQTFLLQRYCKTSIPYPVVLSPLLIIVPIFYLSLTHPSFFYNFSLTFNTLTLTERIDRINMFFPIDLLSVISYASIVIFLLVVPCYLLKFFNRSAAGVALLSGLATLGVMYYSSPVNFVYILHFVLAFHFILFSLIFIEPIRVYGNRAWQEYIWLHILVLFPMGLIAIWWLATDTPLSERVFTNVFDFGVFLTISVVHISVSFLNEPWFQRFVRLC